VKHQFWSKLHWALLVFLLPFFKSYSQNTQPFVIKSTICPNLCKNESLYKIIYSAAPGFTVTASSGVVLNDSTIADIDPKSTYAVTITAKNTANLSLEQTVALPICDFLLPTPAIVSSKSICENDVIPSFQVLTTNSNSTADWFDVADGGIKIATGNTFKPTQAGVYYVQTRDLNTDCKSLSRTTVRLTINKIICVPSTFKIMKGI
jgi:Ig-like domain CHU_C associated